MVRGSYRSNSKKRVDYRTPSGSKQRFEKRKDGQAISPAGKKLAGVRPSQAKTLSRPNRPYGGVLTSAEMREVLRDQARLSLE